MENSMCRIQYEKFQNNIIEGEGSGFFCHFKNDFHLKYYLFTNNQVLNDSDLKIGKIINLKYLKGNKMIQKLIQLTEKREVFTDDQLDYTFIELFKSDEIDNYFEIDPNIYNYNDQLLRNINIFILHYFENEISFSY